MIKLDTDVEDFINKLEANAASPLPAPSPQDERMAYNQSIKLKAFPIPDDVDIIDRQIDTEHAILKARSYRPKGQHQALPTWLFFHGGGWVVGDLESHHDICAEFASSTGHQVISINYRLAPEYPFPAASNDAIESYRLLHQQADTWGIDRWKFGVMGDSSGANLAASLSHQARDKKLPMPKAQLLIYPVLSVDENINSRQTHEDAPLLTTLDMRRYRDHYLPKTSDHQHPYAMPLSDRHFRCLPKTWAISADLDPLRDDVKLYTECINAAGGQATSVNATGLPHSFLRARHSTLRGSAAWHLIVLNAKALLIA